MISFNSVLRIAAKSAIRRILTSPNEASKVKTHRTPTIVRRILGVIQSLMTNGVGRTLLKINDKYQLTTFNKARKYIKCCKMLRHPIDSQRRRQIARKLTHHSSHALLVSEKTGYRILKPGTIPGSDQIVSKCRKLYDASLSELQKKMGQEVFAYLLLANQSGMHDVTLSSGDVYDLTLIPSLTEFVLSPTLVEAASCYLGEVPILAGVTVYVSFPNVTKVGSQLYHLDKGDFRQVKFIFAITDAHEENGPFTFIPADQVSAVEKTIGAGLYTRVPDEQVYAVISKEEVVKFLGPMGSCLIIDTGRCLHYGSRGNTQFRCLLEIQYMSRFNCIEQ